MTTSRRDLMKAVGVGAALAAAGHSAAVPAESNPVPPAEIDPASNAYRELKIVNFDLLEAAGAQTHFRPPVCVHGTGRRRCDVS